MNFTRDIVAPEELDAVLSRVGQLLREMEPEGITNFKLQCFPWRNGKRLQAVVGRNIVDLTIDLPNDPAESLSSDRATIRERPDDLGEMGFGIFLGHDD